MNRIDEEMDGEKGSSISLCRHYAGTRALLYSWGRTYILNQASALKIQKKSKTLKLYDEAVSLSKIVEVTVCICMSKGAFG